MALTHPLRAAPPGSHAAPTLEPAPPAALPASEVVIEELDQQVRAAVRRQGVRPQREEAVVRRIATGVVRDTTSGA